MSYHGFYFTIDEHSVFHPLKHCYPIECCLFLTNEATIKVQNTARPNSNFEGFPLRK